MIQMNLDALRQELEEDEGRTNKLYRCPAGKLTIGVGHNIEQDGVPDQIVDALLNIDIQDAKTDLDRAFPFWRTLSDARQRALVNMCFNMGIRRLVGFKKMWSALGDDDYERAAKEALNSKWAQQVGSRAVRLADMIRKG